MNLPETVKLQEIYGETEVSGARFKNLADHFEKIYKQDKAEYFTIGFVQNDNLRV